MPRSSSISSTKRKHLLFGIRRSVAYCECLADGSSATVDGGSPVNCLPRGGEELTLMLIRYVYDITVTSKYPTPMLSLMAPRPQRSADVRSPDVVVTSPEVVTTTYLDLFGNVCRRFIAPSGDLLI
jgi:hypothetical protein